MKASEDDLAWIDPGTDPFVTARALLAENAASSECSQATLVSSGYNAFGNLDPLEPRAGAERRDFDHRRWAVRAAQPWRLEPDAPGHGARGPRLVRAALLRRVWALDGRFVKRAREDSNLYLRFRRPTLYPAELRAQNSG
jgi:hypothetical protein